MWLRPANPAMSIVQVDGGDFNSPLGIGHSKGSRHYRVRCQFAPTTYSAGNKAT